MSEDLDSAEAMRYYAGFLIGKLNEIYDAWDEGDPELALKRAVRLTLFLPRKLKKKIREDVQIIDKDMKSIHGLNGSDFYNTRLLRDNRSEEIASKYLGPFVDKLTDLIDERGYFEIQGIKPRFPEGKTKWKP